MRHGEGGLALLCYTSLIADYGLPMDVVNKKTLVQGIRSSLTLNIFFFFETMKHAGRLKVSISSKGSSTERETQTLTEA